MPGGGGDVTVYVNGNPVRFDVSPLVEEGTVFVPIRGVFEKMGARVNYNAETGAIHAWRKGSHVEVTVGNRVSTVNGSTVFMLHPAVLTRGRALVPLRFLSEALGGDVDWNPAARTVHIRSVR